MEIENIEKIIDKALKENQSQLIEFVSIKLSINDDQTVNEIVTYISGFVAIIPYMVKSIIDSPVGSSTGIESTLAMSNLENYLLDKNDFIPESQYVGIFGLLDDAYYVITFMQALRGILSNIDIFNEVDLESAQKVFIALIGSDVARKTEVKLQDLISSLFIRIPSPKPPLKNIINKLSTNELSSIGSRFSSSVNGSSIFSSVNVKPSVSYNPPLDPFIEDGRGYPGGAYDNPSSSFYMPDNNNDDYYNFYQ